jgi:hypothetical protein
MILHGTVTSKNKAYGAGIGGGCAYVGNSTVLNVTILNGNITSSYESADPGSGIGSECANMDNATVFNVTILNGNISSDSFIRGSGIGSEVGVKGNSTVFGLMILNGNITSSSSYLGPGVEVDGVILAILSFLILQS